MVVALWFSTLRLYTKETMELEHVLPEINRPKDARQVFEACRHFAEVLTDRKWHRPGMRRTKISREFSHVITKPVSEDPHQLAQTEHYVSVEVKFDADKVVIGYDEAFQMPEFEEVYTVSAGLREDIGADELPDWIRGQVVQGVKLHDPDNHDDEGMAVELGPIDPEALDSFKFEKLMEVEYVFDEDVEIADYAVRCAYFCDGGIIDRVKYSWSDDAVEYVSTVLENMSVENHPAFDRPLSEADVQAFEESFDTIIDALYDLDAFSKLEEDTSGEGMYLTEDIHCRRAMAMIALNSRRFIGMRIK